MIEKVPKNKNDVNKRWNSYFFIILNQSKTKNESLKIPSVTAIVNINAETIIINAQSGKPTTKFPKNVYN